MQSLKNIESGGRTFLSVDQTFLSFSNRNKFLFLPAIMVALALVALPACGKKDKAKGNTVAAPLAVKVGVVVQKDVQDTLSLVGSVLPNRKALITSKVQGKVVKIYSRDGDRVKKNAPLAKVDPEDIDRGLRQAQAVSATAYAALSQAQVQREIMQNELNRMTALSEKEAISKQEFERVEAGYKASGASVKMAEAGVNQANAALGTARSYRRESVIRAPFEGEVARLLVEEGERIQMMPPTPVMVLMDYDTVQVECQVTEREVGTIKEGMPAILRLDAFPNATLEATVTRIVPVLDPASRSFAVRIDLPNADHKIKPGMMARVNITVVYPNMIVVNRDATSLNNVTGQRRIVEVVDSKAVERFSLLGRSFGNWVELTDLNGLAVGSKVIISGAGSISTGTPVHIVASEESP